MIHDPRQQYSDQCLRVQRKASEIKQIKNNQYILMDAS